MMSKSRDNVADVAWLREDQRILPTKYEKAIKKAAGNVIGLSCVIAAATAGAAIRIGAEIINQTAHAGRIIGSSIRYELVGRTRQEERKLAEIQALLSEVDEALS